MATIRLPPDFSEFLRLLAEAGVEYLIVGGYAVAYHGHPRATGDMDIWIQMSDQNARRIEKVLKAFGFNLPELSAGLFTMPDQVIRMGNPPLRIEILTTIDGVDFSDCYERRINADLDGVPVQLIALEDLKKNKRAAARPQDLSDLERL
jgi:predicted nucleotidyltransferase